MRSNANDVKAQQQQKNIDVDRLNELKANNKKTAEEKAEYEKLLSQLSNEILQNPSIINPSEQPSEKPIYTLASDDDLNDRMKMDIEELIKNYEASGRKLGMHNGKPALVFNSFEEAITFFKEQTDKGLAFQLTDSTGQHCVYSDGKTFVQGTPEDVENYKKNPQGFDLDPDTGKLTNKNTPTPFPST